MVASSKFKEAIDPDQSLLEKHFPINDSLSDASRSMLLLERLASTLGVPVDLFFAEVGRSSGSDGATPDEIAGLTEAFVAITDPVMRRYCLDVVRTAGAKGGNDGPAPASL